MARQKSAEIIGERSMRVAVLVLLAISLVSTPGAEPPPSRSNSGEDVQRQRIAALIRQLGDKEFAKREAAGKELDAIGEPALDALRKAASNDDAEVRQRAAKIVLSITGRARAAAAKQELAKWEGVWESGGQALVIKGDRWLWSSPGRFPFDEVGDNRLTVIEVGEKVTLADLQNGEQVCRAIFRLDGDTLHYCGTYDAQRPTEFRAERNNVYVAWKRAKADEALVAEFQFDGDALPTDLHLPESKEAVRRVTVKCRPTDRGAGTLTLDPNAPKLNEFGDAVGGGKPSPVVNLDFTLKLVKKETDRRLFEVRGPKIEGRLSLVVFRGVTPWGDARLLVNGKDGEVRYAINLRLPQQQQQLLLPPCHPGCFPAGTMVRTPDGTTAIERIHKGDLIRTVDAAGKPSSTKVTGVFVTRNRVLEVQVEGAKLVTTETQPLALVNGGFRAAGELKAGDRVWQWVNGERQAAAVLKVSPADRETQVFNVVVGEVKAFIAADFLVRSKPPPPPQP
jgi:hypothetical protein